jgi:hypothetical protein
VFNTFKLFLGDDPKENPLDLDLLWRVFNELKLESDKLL